MADYENRLLSKAVQTGHIEDLISCGIDTSHFTTEDNQEIWNFLFQYFKKYKSSPAFETVREAFPDYNWSVSSEPLDYIYEKFETKVVTRKTTAKLEHMAELIDDNQESTLRKLPEIFLDQARDLSRIVHQQKFLDSLRCQRELLSITIAKRKAIISACHLVFLSWTRLL